MNMHIVVLLFLMPVLAILLYMKSGVRKKYLHKSWLERIETIAKENQILFSTHIAYYQKSKISSELLKLEEEQKGEGLELKMSNIGGWHSESDILKYSSVQRLFKKLLPTVETYSQTIGLDPKHLTITAWANINREGNINLKHTHEDALFSGCYYLKVSAKEKMGEISFFKKRDPNYKHATYYPEAGDLLLFPSDMQHSVNSHSELDNRISIAFNVHYGNKKKSWLISSIYRSEIVGKLDPHFDHAAIPNSPKYADTNDRKSMLFHTSKIKSRFSK